MTCSLNPPKGYMFKGFHTVNPITGCTFNCHYCYLHKGKYPHDMRLQFHEHRLDNWGKAPKKIFVGSAGDMWGVDVKWTWIEPSLEHCRLYRQHLYLFLTKRPEGYSPFLLMDLFPPRAILGVTLETNRDIPNISKAPSPMERALQMLALKDVHPPNDIQDMISIEPIMKFDLHVLVEMIADIKPAYVSIGPDTKRCGLPEPTSIEVCDLLLGLREITEVRVKSELYRLVEHRFTEKEWLKRLEIHDIIHPDFIIDEKVIPPKQLSLL